MRRPLNLRPLRQIPQRMRYVADYLSRGDVRSVVDGLRFAVVGSPPTVGRRLTTPLGTFACRPHTTDFIHVSPVYEAAVRELLVHDLGDGGVFLEIGACLGETSIALARRGVRCLTFEPDPDNHRVLRENIRLNDLGHRIRTYEMALGGSTRKVPFYSQPVNRGASRRVQEGTGDCLWVEQRPLDTLMGSLDLDPDEHLAVKIDAEGMEVEIVLGGREFLARHRSVTVVAESKHVDTGALREALELAGFDEFGRVDAHNIYGRKRPTCWRG